MIIYVYYILISILVLVSCGEPPKRASTPTEDKDEYIPPKPTPKPTPDDEKDVNKKAALFKKRLEADFVKNGFFLNLRKSKKLIDTESAMYFSSVAMVSLSCVESQKVFDAIETSVMNRSGAVVRFDPIPDDYQAGRETDMITERMFWAAMLERLASCRSNEGETSRIKALWKKHIEFIIRNSFEVYPSTDIFFSEGDRSSILFINELMGSKAYKSSQALEAYVIAETKQAVLNNSDCDKVHGLFSLLIGIESVGGEVTNKTTLCDISKQIKNPLIDKWCGKPSDSWLSKFKMNQYYFKMHQCFDQKPDVTKGSESSALDFLLVYSKKNL